jgi:hypothetical protein
MANTSWMDSAATSNKFLSVLIDADLITDTDDVQQFLSKPQRYSDVYEAWDDAGFPESEDENWDEFVESVSDDESTDEEDNE